MNILYTRISSIIGQKNDRQVQNLKEFDYVVEDKCSGATPFFERDGGKRIEKMISKNQVTKISVHQIDRLGRNLLDILNTCAYFNKKGICIHFIQQGIKTLNVDGTENPISKMIISILGVVAEMERNLIKERQAEGVAIAKAKGVYKGRGKGTKETNLDFLNKPKVKKAIFYLNNGMKGVEVQKLAELHPNTITKIKKLNQLMNNGK
jgi:DNA invertase Pin-like site-specific DNA recombinase